MLYYSKMCILSVLSGHFSGSDIFASSCCIKKNCAETQNSKNQPFMMSQRAHLDLP